MYIYVLLIKIVPERNGKKFKLYFNNFISCNYLFLANCELNYTPFWCTWSICPNLRKLLKQVS